MVEKVVNNRHNNYFSDNMREELDRSMGTVPFFVLKQLLVQREREEERIGVLELMTH